MSRAGFGRSGFGAAICVAAAVFLWRFAAQSLQIAVEWLAASRFLAAAAARGILLCFVAENRRSYCSLAA